MSDPRFVDATGHRTRLSQNEHRIERAFGCNDSICPDCGCCGHCTDCICPDGPCTNDNCGCWIDERYPKV